MVKVFGECRGGGIIGEVWARASGMNWEMTRSSCYTHLVVSSSLERASPRKGNLRASTPISAKLCQRCERDRQRSLGIQRNPGQPPQQGPPPKDTNIDINMDVDTDTDGDIEIHIDADIDIDIKSHIHPTKRLAWDAR